MNYKKLLLLSAVMFELIACKSTQVFSDDILLHERQYIPSAGLENQFEIYWKARNVIADGIECSSTTWGICLNPSDEFNTNEPTCVAMNENNRILMAIPQYNNGLTVNPQYEMFNGMEVWQISDSLVLWNEETLEALDFTTPIAVLPDEYRITRSHDTLYLNLQTSPVNLEKKVCAFFYYDNHILQSARFQDYYEGFLDASDIMTGTVSEVSEEYLILTFSYELNVSDALNEVRYISDNRIFSLREDITCNDYSICHILGFSDFFRLLHGEYEIEMIESGFRVKIPYILR